jgi:leucyl aminopeptidase
MIIQILAVLFIQSFVHAETVTVTGSSKMPVQMSQDQLLQLAQKHHEQNNYCGGFVASLKGESFLVPSIVPVNMTDYSLSRASVVENYINQVNEPRLIANIEWFSSYLTRFYTTPTGVQAMKDLADKWGQMVKHLDYAKVKLYQHKDWPQPSVILTIKGETDDLIVVGGHGDSINTDINKPTAPAPGADDNASGISVITEVIQVLSDNSYRPKHTIQFIAYAAEEVGLLGSMEITDKYQTEKKNVRGVIQFDGTNFNGSKDLSIVLIRDHTDKEQNLFIGKLIDTYVKVKWGYDECGYACTDSYSWTYRGYTASFPAEARLKEENPHIHSARDTLAVSLQSATHAVKFAKLGLAYVVELDK